MPNVMRKYVYIIRVYLFRLTFWDFTMRFIVVLSLIMGFAHSQEISEFRLPKTFKPVSYRLDINTHLDKFTFDGVVDIKVSVK